MINKAKVVTILLIFLCGKAAGGVFFFEPLDEIPAGSGEKASLVESRIRGQDAVLLEDETILFEFESPENNFFIEFWFRPEGWDAFSGTDAEILSFSTGREEFILLKPRDAAEIQLVNRGRVLQSYPAYNIFMQDWVDLRGADDINRSAGWNHVNISVFSNRATLSINGFPARTVRNRRVFGRLKAVELKGSPSAAFSGLAAGRSKPLSTSGLWSRFCASYKGRANIRRNFIAVPYLEIPPAIDGNIEGAEWKGASLLSGFVSVKEGRLLEDEITARIGYDSQNIYISVETPYEGELEAREWGKRGMPLWEEESFEFFFIPPLSGHDNFIQLLGNPYGDQTDVIGGRLHREGDWRWETVVRPLAWTAELKAPFRGIEAPGSEEGGTWMFNMINTKAGAAWSKATGLYRSPESMSFIEFRRCAPPVKPGRLLSDKDSFRIHVEVTGRGASREFAAGIEVFGENDFLPRRQARKTFILGDGENKTFELEVCNANISSGIIAFYVRENDSDIYYKSFAYPAKRGREL